MKTIVTRICQVWNMVYGGLLWQGMKMHYLKRYYKLYMNINSGIHIMKEIAIDSKYCPVISLRECLPNYHKILQDPLGYTKNGPAQCFTYSSMGNSYVRNSDKLTISSVDIKISDRFSTGHWTFARSFRCLHVSWDLKFRNLVKDLVRNFRVAIQQPAIKLRSNPSYHDANTSDFLHRKYYFTYSWRPSYDLISLVNRRFWRSMYPTSKEK